MYPTSVQEAIDSHLLVVSSLRTEQILQCVVCNLELNGPVPAEMHLQGKNHKKASARFRAVNGQDFASLPSNNPILAANQRDPHNGEESEAKIQRLKEQGVVEEFSMAGAQYFSCTVCRCPSICGVASLLSHLDGKQHKKMRDAGRMIITNLSISHLSLSCSSTPQSSCDISSTSLDLSLPSRSFSSFSTSGELNASLESGELRVCSQLGFYECIVCNTTVTGEVSAIQHIQGKQHKKNSLSSRSVSSSSACGGSIPSYQVPATSFNQAAALPSVALADEDCGEAVATAVQSGVLRRVVFQGSHDHFECLVCCTGGTMNGHRTAQSHLVGKSHLSMSRRVKLSGSVQSTATATEGAAKPCSHSSTGRDTSQEHSEVMTAVEGGVLMLKRQAGVELYECQVCEMAMAGPIAARAHLTGRNHHVAITRHSARENRGPSSSLRCSSPRSGSPSASPSRPSSHITSPLRPVSRRSPSPEPAVEPVSDSCLAVSLSLDEVLVEEQQNGTNLYYCVSCGVTATRLEDIKLHLATRQHQHSTSQLYSTPRSSPSPSPTRRSGNDAFSSHSVLDTDYQDHPPPGVLNTSSQHHPLPASYIQQQKAALPTMTSTTLIAQLLASPATEPGQIDLAGLLRDGTVLVEHVRGLQQYCCVPCNVISNGLSTLKQHIIGETHKKQTRRLAEANGVRPQQQSGVMPTLPSCSASSHNSISDTEHSSDDERILVIRVDEPIPPVWTR